MGTSPKEQHAEIARKILARRGNASVTPAKVHAKPSVTPVKIPPVPPATSLYTGKGIKELRELCTAREIAFKKKDTIAKLTEKLEAN